MNYKIEYEKWINTEYFDKTTKKELLNIKESEAEIEDRFYKNLEFGTGGMRGEIGAGTNRMNLYTVRKATVGLAQYISSFGEEAKGRGAVIAYDSRHKSPEFALEAAKLFMVQLTHRLLFSPPSVALTKTSSCGKLSLM